MNTGLQTRVLPHDRLFLAQPERFCDFSTDCELEPSPVTFAREPDALIALALKVSVGPQLLPEFVLGQDPVELPPSLFDFAVVRDGDAPA